MSIPYWSAFSQVDSTRLELRQHADEQRHCNALLNAKLDALMAVPSLAAGITNASHAHTLVMA